MTGIQCMDKYHSRKYLKQEKVSLNIGVPKYLLGGGGKRK